LDALLDVGGPPAPPAPVGMPSSIPSNPAVGGLLGDIFGLSASPATYIAPKTLWLPAVKGKGLEISGTFSRRNGQIYMDMTFTNKAMQPMSGFAIQFNKNSFGIIPGQTLQVPTPLTPNQPCEVSLPMNTTGPVQKMEPLNNLQVAVKNNVDVLYFACLIPMNVLFVEDGQMDKRVFLQTWKDIPTQNEVQYTITNVSANSDAVVQKMQQNNIFTIAKRNVEGQDMLYQSLKLTNNVWVLAEVKIPPSSNNCTVSLSIKSIAVDVAAGVYAAYEGILRS
jgi:AP-1 complex subunit beta-1